MSGCCCLLLVEPKPRMLIQLWGGVGSWSCGDATKASLSASDPEVGRLVAVAMGKRAGAVTDSARVLGVDFVLARPGDSHLMVNRLRCSNAKMSLGRIMALRGVSAGSWR